MYQFILSQSGESGFKDYGSEKSSWSSGLPRVYFGKGKCDWLWLSHSAELLQAMPENRLGLDVLFLSHRCMCTIHQLATLISFKCKQPKQTCALYYLPLVAFHGLLQFCQALAICIALKMLWHWSKYDYTWLRLQILPILWLILSNYAFHLTRAPLIKMR